MVVTARAAFRQADVVRALKAARAAGEKVERFEIESVTGKIVVYTDAKAANDDGPSDWD